MDSIKTNVAGSYFYKETYDKVKTGDVVYLVKEPENPYDKDAIKVVNTENKTIGHVTNSKSTCRMGSKKATELQSFFEHKLRAVIYEKDEKNCYLIANPSNQGFLQRLRK